MRAIIAVAEYPEDPFRLACLLTLSEIGAYFASIVRVNLRRNIFAQFLLMSTWYIEVEE